MNIKKERDKVKQICLFCEKEIKRKDKKKYGFCISCKIDMIRTMIKPEYTLMVKGKIPK